MNCSPRRARELHPWPTSALLLTLLASACSPGDPEADSPAQAAEGAGQHEGHLEDESASGVVRWTRAQVDAASIRVEAAGPAEVSKNLRLPAVVAPNADAVAHVNPKVPGVVRSVDKHLGEHVSAGDLLCVIDSVELGKTVAEAVRAQALAEAAELTLQRERDLFEERIRTADRVLEAEIEVDRRIFDRESELREKAVSTIRPFLEAEKSLEKAVLARDRQLTDLRAERDARVLQLEVQVRERLIQADAAHNQLTALGIDSDGLSDLSADSPLLAGRYEVRASRPGVVATRHISPGQYVDGESTLFTIEDLSVVWVIASAYEDQLASVRTGQQALVALDAFPEVRITGTVLLIGYEVDRESRALGVRIALENAGIPSWPEPFPVRPGMYGSVEVRTDVRTAAVVVPESAIVHDPEGDYVFVREGPLSFEQRRVDYELVSGGLVEVRAGLEPEEQVVVSGTFGLKSSLHSDELGEGHEH